MSPVAVSAGAGAVAGLVGFYAFPVFLPTAGSTLADFVIAGGMTGIVAGQAAESSALLLGGNGNQIISSFAQPDHVLNNFAWGAVGGGIGYGVHSVLSYINSSLSGLSEFSYPDEFSSPRATGQWRNWDSTWEQQHYLSVNVDNSIVDNVRAYNQSWATRPASLPTDEVFWAQAVISSRFTDGTPLEQGVINYQNNPSNYS